MWGRWSSTLGLRVYSTRLLLSLLILKERKWEKVLQIISNHVAKIHINKKRQFILKKRKITDRCEHFSSRVLEIRNKYQ